MSIKDKRTYTGYTSNISKRLKDHNTGKVHATRYRRPLSLRYLELHTTKKAAKIKESWWKSSTGRRAMKKLFK